MVGELGENESKDQKANEIKVVDVKGIRDNFIYNMPSDVQLLTIIVS